MVEEKDGRKTIQDQTTVRSVKISSISDVLRKKRKFPKETSRINTLYGTKWMP